MWKGDLGEVCNGAAAEIRVVSVTSLLAWAVTISANVNKLAASVGYDLVAPKHDFHFLVKSRNILPVCIVLRGTMLLFLVYDYIATPKRGITRKQKLIKKAELKQTHLIGMT